MRKWLSYRKIHAIVRVAKSKKKGAAVKKYRFFFHRFFMNTLYQSVDPKQEFIEDASRDRCPSKRTAADGWCERLQILCHRRARNRVRKVFGQLGETIDGLLSNQKSENY